MAKNKLFGKPGHKLIAALMLATVFLFFLIYFSTEAQAPIPDKETYESPPENPRYPAEFEPTEAVLVRYPLAIPPELVAELSKDVRVITIVADAHEQEGAIQLYQENNVHMHNVDFLFAPTEGPWTRDYSPFFVFTENGMELIDITYKEERPGDNNIPLFYADATGLPVHLMPLTHRGGNMMTDGYGMAISTDLIDEANPDFSIDEIKELSEEYLGIGEYHIVPDANGEYIQHIDCWAKLLAPNVLLIREVPPTHSQYDELEAAADYFSSQNSSYGTPFEVRRIYTPNNESYTNSLIVNNKVLIPLEGTEWDDEAIEAYQEAMPGYEVIGFEEPEEYPWLSTDSLHCRTQGAPDSQMLYIKHVPLQGEVSELKIQAEIIPYSGEEVTSVVVFYKIGEAEWQTELLKPTDQNLYAATLPEQPPGTALYYYIYAEDNSGRGENHPYTGRENPHIFVAG